MTEAYEQERAAMDSGLRRCPGAIGFVALLVLSDGFGRSFGASDNGPLLSGGPLLVMLVFLVSLLLPGQRVLLHVAAATATALAACSAWVLSESVFMGVLERLSSGLSLTCSWHTASTGAAAPSP